MFKDLPSGETHCDLIADAKQRALDLYNPPFQIDLNRIYDRFGVFVCEPSVKSESGELIAEALNEYWEKHNGN